MKKSTLALAALATATTFCIFASNNASAADSIVSSQAEIVNPATGDNFQAQLLVFGTSIMILMIAVFIAAPIDS